MLVANGGDECKKPPPSNGPKPVVPGTTQPKPGWHDATTPHHPMMSMHPPKGGTCYNHKSESRLRKRVGHRPHSGTPKLDADAALQRHVSAQTQISAQRSTLKMSLCWVWITVSPEPPEHTTNTSPIKWYPPRHRDVMDSLAHCLVGRAQCSIADEPHHIVGGSTEVAPGPLTLTIAAAFIASPRWRPKPSIEMINWSGCKLSRQARLG